MSAPPPPEPSDSPSDAPADNAADSGETPDAQDARPTRDYSPTGKPKTPLWRVRWFQVTLGVLLLLAVASYVVPAIFRLVYATRSVLTPVLVGIALAYVLNPVVTWLHARWRIPRPVTAATMLGSALISGAVFVLVVVPLVLFQALELVQRLPGAIRELSARDDLPVAVQPFVKWLAATLTEIDAAAKEFFDGTLRQAEQVTQTGTATADGAEDAAAPGVFDGMIDSIREVDWKAVAEMFSTALDLGAGTVSSVFGTIGYLSVAVVIVSFVFFFTVWKFRDFVLWFDPYVPASKKERAYAILHRMDASVSAFIRGRLIQATIMAVVLTIGLLFTDARPYALLLGVAGGILGLVPYVGLVVWPAAVLVAVIVNLQNGESVSLVWAVIAPSVVFFIAQSLDAYVVEPVVQGKATNLDALTVLLVVLLGGSLAGLLGLLIAIPAAACLKILWAEAIAPELKEIARQA